MVNKIAGVTSINGISFFGENAKLVVRDKDGAFAINKYNSVLKKEKNIPFLRGFYRLYNSFVMVSGTIIGKIAFIFFMIGILSMIANAIFGGPGIEPGMIGQASDAIIMIVNIVFILFLIFFVLRIRNLHGLEHKFINAYKKDLPITLENVKKQRKESPFCGGTLLGVIFILELILYLIGASSLFIWILVPTLAYEMFLLSTKGKWYSKILFAPGFLLQQLTTGNKVSDKKIEQYVEAFNAFKVIENR